MYTGAQKKLCLTLRGDDGERHGKTPVARGDREHGGGEAQHEDVSLSLKSFAPETLVRLAHMSDVDGHGVGRLTT